MDKLTISEAIKRIDSLIDAGKYDVSRLDNIRKSLKYGKILFNSDQQYLEKLLGSPITYEDKEITHNPLLPLVKQLIDSGSGDYGRLQYIYDLLLKGRSLYHSDQVYLQKKLDETANNSASLHDEEIKSIEIKDESQSFKSTLHPKGELSQSWDENKFVTQKSTDSDQSDMQKNEVSELTTSERENLQLSEIKQTSKEQKRLIESINDDLDSQIKIERETIASNINEFKRITIQKEELEKIKTETISILDKIKKEKEDLLKESKLQEENLIRVQKEQGEIEKNIVQEQKRIQEMQESQKSNLGEKIALLKELKEKELELENTKTEFDEIQNTLEQERQVIESESTKQKENLAKLQSEKKSLEATQDDYDS
ncbi:MAG: hypothetical protein OEY54_05620, partial [Nitrosopumilus sp.]|nr:hypothetical protein [Nitrosopumilus sp.]